MNEKLNDAFNEISEAHISEAAKPKKRFHYIWYSAVAAVLALGILAGSLPKPDGPSLSVTEPSTAPWETSIPSTDSTGSTETVTPSTAPWDPPKPPPADPYYVNLAAAPQYPVMPQCPKLEDYPDYKTYSAARTAWQTFIRQHYSQPEGYADSLTNFFCRSTQEFLSQDSNSTYSPLNLYMALAMLAETAGGNSRQQLLDLFGLSSIEELRTQANHLWNAHYRADGVCRLQLANALWLDEAFSFRQSTVDKLAQDYYASTFHGDLGTESINQQLRQWINHQTGDLLKDQTQELSLPRDTALALVSTIWFTANWSNRFNENRNTDRLFHTGVKDISTQFMNDSQNGTYYRGSSFGAIRLHLEGSNGMWLILPDEGVSLQTVLQSNEYLQMTLHPEDWENKDKYYIHLSVPKFNISSNTDLIKGIQNMGITDIFNPAVSNFSPMIEDRQLVVTQMNHAARVSIDEDGVEAAAVTIIASAPTGSQPSSQEIDFILDRPFLFVISSQDNLPLFAGTVVEP